MPTENRSSNTEMVSVPREAVVQAAELLQEYNKCRIARDLRAILAQPAVQNQGEPVPLPANMHPHDFDNLPEAHCNGWNACLDEIAKLGPLYSRPVQGEPVAWRGINDLGEVVTEWIDGVHPENMVDLCGNPARFAKIEQAFTHADPGEVERLRAKIEQLRTALRGRQEQWSKLENALLAKLAERDALLRHLYGHNELSLADNQLILSALSASAEPSAPVERMSAIRSEAAELSSKLKNACCQSCMSNPCDCAIQSAPVEIDERAELEVYCTKVGLPLDRLPSGEYMIPATRFVSQGWHAHAASSRKQ